MQENYNHWLDDLPEKVFLEKILCSFSKFSGLKAQLVDTEGHALMSTENDVPDCTFCQLIKGSEKGRLKCQRSYARAGREAAKYGEPYIFRCHAGLIAWAAPIILNQHEGAVICGQVLMWEPEDYFLDEIGMMIKGLDVDINKVKQATVLLNVLSSDKVQAISDLLFVIANQIMNKEPTIFTQQRDMYLHQSSLSEEIRKLKLEERTKCLAQTEYSPGKEQQLLAKIRSGEKDSAEKILDNMLIQILNCNIGNLGNVRTRIVELLVMISRAAIDGGTDSKNAQNLNVRFFDELYHKESPEEICFWTKSMVDVFIEEVNKAKNKNNTQAIYSAAEFMQKNYMEKISIGDIAEEVHLSASYLSHIFSQTFGCTLTDYLTRIRLNQAKIMLGNLSMSIGQVAVACGFDDVSYFSRVFKKVEGISPSEYKKKAVRIQEESHE